MERLALLCGPRFGLVRSAQPWLGAAAADAPGVRTFEGLQHECVRVFAVTSAPMGILVRILSPQGEPVAGAASERTYLAAPQDGAYCLASSGQHTIELRTGGTNEPVAMQLWVLR